MLQEYILLILFLGERTKSMMTYLGLVILGHVGVLLLLIILAVRVFGSQAGEGEIVTLASPILERRL